MNDANPAEAQLEREVVALRRRVAELEAESAALLDHAPIMIAIVDQERRVRSINQAAVEFTGRSAEEMINLRGGEALRCLHALDHLEGCGYGPFCVSCPVRLAVEGTFDTGSSHHQVAARLPVVRGEVQEERDLLVSTSLLDERRVVAYFQDISDFRRVQEERHQAQRYELIGQLAAGVAHEINNPLTLVLGYARLLLKLDLDPALRPRLEAIHEGGLRAAAIAERLLAFARRQQAIKQPQDLNALVREALDLVRYLFGTHRVELTDELAEDLPMVEVNGGQIQQVLLGLLQNSQEAILRARQGGVVQVRTRAEEGRVFLEVEDDGPGISGEVLDHVFDPGFTTKDQGNGYGLTIARRIVQAHHGELRVKSLPGHGTVFRLDLPVNFEADASPDTLASTHQ